MFRNGKLVSTTSSRLVSLFGESRIRLEELDQLNQSLARFFFRAAAWPVANDGLLVALVPTGDVAQASRHRKLIGLVGNSLLTGAMLVFGLLIARQIADPLESMAAATKNMVRGNYKRLTPKEIPIILREN